MDYGYDIIIYIYIHTQYYDIHKISELLLDLGMKFYTYRQCCSLVRDF